MRDETITKFGKIFSPTQERGICTSKVRVPQHKMMHYHVGVVEVYVNIVKVDQIEATLTSTPL
jgi:hypothetical protein